MNVNRLLPVATLLALAAFAWSGSDYYTGLAVKIMIYAVFALSLQLLVGGAGLVLVEATKIDPRGCSTPRDLGLWKDEFVPACAASSSW